MREQGSIAVVHTQAIAHVGGQRRIKWFARANQGVVDRVACAAFANNIEEFVQGINISVAQRTWITIEEIFAFQPVETRWPSKGKVKLLVVHHMEHHDVMATLPQQSQPPKRILGIDQEIGYENHHSAAGKILCDTAHNIAYSCLVGWLGDVERIDYRKNM